MVCPPSFTTWSSGLVLFRLAGLMRSEMEGIVIISYSNRKTKALEERKLAAVVSVAAALLVEPHTLANGGGFQSNSGGQRFRGARQ